MHLNLSGGSNTTHHTHTSVNGSSSAGGINGGGVGGGGGGGSNVIGSSGGTLLSRRMHPYTRPSPPPPPTQLSNGGVGQGEVGVKVVLPSTSTSSDLPPGLIVPAPQQPRAGENISSHPPETAGVKTGLFCLLSFWQVL